MGIQLGGGAGGLTPDAYPSVLESREVRLAVARDTFYFPTLDKRMTFIQYANRDPGLLGIVLDYTIRLPWTILGHLTGSERTVSEEETKERRENRAIGQIGQMVASSVNRETGLMTISATAGSPELAAEVTRRSVQHLRSRVREIRTQKVQQSLSFVEQRFEEAQEELEAAENRLAAFLERNQNANSSQLRFERDRLQRQVTFKEQLYSNLQNQLTQTRLDLQRQQPVVTIVERPVPPPSPSAPQRTLILILFVAFGAVVGTAGAIGRSLFDSSGADQESRRKVEEIKEHVALPSRVKNGIERVRGSLTGNKNAENEAEEDPSSR
jgi:capsular polysaccharide biosynthesis protein